jgi:tRNA-specific 2-thiouridylase
VVGEHDGIAGFTIGQRRGLGVALGEPRYVVDIQPHTATVVIGPRRHLRVGSVRLRDVTFTHEPVSGGVTVQYRAHGEPVPAVLAGDTVVFEEPQEGIAPGQTVAFYDGDRVLGGGIIVATER